jgi:hypothetical protein
MSVFLFLDFSPLSPLGVELKLSEWVWEPFFLVVVAMMLLLGIIGFNFLLAD